MCGEELTGDLPVTLVFAAGPNATSPARGHITFAFAPCDDGSNTAVGQFGPQHTHAHVASPSSVPSPPAMTLAHRCCRTFVALFALPLLLCAQRGSPQGAWEGDCYGFRLNDRVGVATRSCNTSLYRQGDTIIRIVHRDSAAFTGEMIRLDTKAFVPVTGSVHGADSLRLFFTEGSLFVRRRTEPIQSGETPWRVDALAPADPPSAAVTLSVKLKRGALLRVMDSALGGLRLEGTITPVAGAAVLTLTFREQELKEVAAEPPPRSHLVLTADTLQLTLPSFPPERERVATTGAMIGVIDTYRIPLTGAQAVVIAQATRLAGRLRRQQLTITPLTEAERVAILDVVRRQPPTRPTLTAPVATATPSQSAPGASAGAPLRLVKVPGSWRAELDAQVQAAVTRWNPRFRMWTLSEIERYARPCGGSTGPCPKPDAVPWAASADFTGDGRLDVILRGHDASKQYEIAVIATETGYAIEVVSEYEYQRGQSLDTYLALQPAGRIEACDGTIYMLRVAGFLTQVPDKGGPAIHYRESGKWKEAYTGC